MEFDFGPISRTVDASTGKGDAINFASLPVHEALTALLGATNRDEFVAWLWHDLFKPLFWWQWNSKKSKFSWIHYPNNTKSDPFNVEAHWSGAMNIPSGLVATHHHSHNRLLTYGERQIVNNEFDQVAIGEDARFVQLSFLAEPATNTALLRAVIADAFAEVVTKVVAKSIEAELETKSPTFKRIRYGFDFNQVALSTPPAEAEIASLAAQYALKAASDELIVRHVVPTSKLDLNGRHIEVVIDLTGAPPTPEQFEQGVISLVELLTIYRDSRTILMGIPQFLQIDIQQLKQQVQYATEQRLQALDILAVASEKDVEGQAKTLQKLDWSTLPLKRQGQEIDLLAHAFDEQVEVRLIDRGQLTQTVKVRGSQVRWLDEVVSRPVDLLQGKPRYCRFCNTTFNSAFPHAEAGVKGAFSGDFTDIEHVGFGGDICPMCRIYALNNKFFKPREKARGKSGARKAYRGAFALLAPSSHFTYTEENRPIEQPPLDVGGRFASLLQRATVTLQEYALFNSLSRRIIARIWTQLDAANKTQSLSLPYLGAVLFTERDAQRIREDLFDQFEMLFDEVVLWAYPFRIAVQPAVEIAFEMAVNDKEKHLTKHTYLKTSPSVVAVNPDSKFNVLVDNRLQLEVNREFFEDRKRVNELLKGIKGQGRQCNWLLAVLQGEDPVTATAEAFYDRSPFWQAERMFWDTQLSAMSPAEQWQQYEEVRDEIRRIVAKYPMLIEFFAKPRRR